MDNETTESGVPGQEQPDNVVQGNFPQHPTTPEVSVNEATPLNCDGVTLSGTVSPASAPAAFIEMIEMPRVIQEPVGARLSTVNSPGQAKELLLALITLFGIKPEHPSVFEAMRRLISLPPNTPIKFGFEAFIPAS